RDHGKSSAVRVIVGFRVKLDAESQRKSLSAVKARGKHPTVTSQRARRGGGIELCRAVRISFRSGPKGHETPSLSTRQSSERSVVKRLAECRFSRYNERHRRHSEDQSR